MRMEVYVGTGIGWRALPLLGLSPQGRQGFPALPRIKTIELPFQRFHHGLWITSPVAKMYRIHCTKKPAHLDILLAPARAERTPIGGQ
jgi:hypothetical protein